MTTRRTPATADEDTAVAITAPLIKAIKENPKSLLVANQTEADNARDLHDYFNLVALVSVLGR
jgi:hypothetical protein